MNLSILITEGCLPKAKKSPLVMFPGSETTLKILPALEIFFFLQQKLLIKMMATARYLSGDASQ